MATIKKSLKAPVAKKVSSKRVGFIDAMKVARQLGTKLVKEKKLKPL